MFSRDDIIDMFEGFLTVFGVSLTAAIVSGETYRAPNIWAVVIGVVGGITAAVRKVQAHRAPGKPPSHRHGRGA